MGPVLIVDDSEDIRMVVRDFLADEGYLVLEAPDGIAALRVLRDSPRPLLVLLDERLPGLSGTELLQRVATSDTDLMRHAYTLVTASDPNGPWAKLPFAVDVLRKPFDLDDLLAMVEGMGRALRH